jgi:hypothetical protein
VKKNIGFWLFVLIGLLIICAPASAQTTLVDHWKTVDECLKATNAPFYYPTILSKKSLATGESGLGHPTGGCADMDLPDRLGNRGWVRIELGRKLIYGSRGEILRLEECDNKIHAFISFPPIQGLKGEVGLTGTQGIKGDVGPQGLQGLPGRDGLNGRDGRDAFNDVRPLWKEPKSSRCGGKCKVFVVIGAATATYGICRGVGSCGGHHENKATGVGPGGNTGPAF